jgi:hypothetical protein
MIKEDALTIVTAMKDVDELSADVTAVKGKDLGDAEVLALVRFSRLTQVSLAGCTGITDKALQGLSKLTSLEELDLTLCNQITDRGIFYLSLLPALRSLNLITDAGVTSLACLPKLKKLDLPEFARITDRAIAKLAENAASLEELRLANLAELTDEGLTSLAKCKKLRTLSVEECPKVTPAGISALKAALPSCLINYT